MTTRGTASKFPAHFDEVNRKEMVLGESYTFRTGYYSHPNVLVRAKLREEAWGRLDQFVGRKIRKMEEAARTNPRNDR